MDDNAKLPSYEDATTLDKNDINGKNGKPVGFDNPAYYEEPKPESSKNGAKKDDDKDEKEKKEKENLDQVSLKQLVSYDRSVSFLSLSPSYSIFEFLQYIEVNNGFPESLVHVFSKTIT